MPEAFGIRLPPPANRLTEVDFDLVPNKPPPADPLYEEVEEEVEDEDQDEDMPMAGEGGDGDATMEERDGLFDSDEDDSDIGDLGLAPQANTNGTPSGPVKRKLEEEDYD